jgi:hypothetical protein
VRSGYRLRRLRLAVVLLAIMATVGASLFFLPYATGAATQHATPLQVIGQSNMPGRSQPRRSSKVRLSISP